MYLFVDTETGGIGLDKSLLQIGMVLTDDKFNPVAEYQWNTKPDDGVYKCTAKALEINGINLVEHDKSAITYREMKTQLYNVLYDWSQEGKNKLIPVGKNVYFDLTQLWNKVISRESWEHFVSYGVMDISTVVTYLQARGTIPSLKKTSLAAMCEYFDIPVVNLHTANGDNHLGIQLMKELVSL